MFAADHGLGRPAAAAPGHVGSPIPRSDCQNRRLGRSPNAPPGRVSPHPHPALPCPPYESHLLERGPGAADADRVSPHLNPRPVVAGCAPRDRGRATSAGLLLILAGLFLHGILWSAYGAVPGRIGAQAGALALQATSAAAIWALRGRLANWFWPAVTLVATMLIGTVPSTYPQAALGVLSLLFVHVMFASRLLTRGVARVVTAEAIVVAAWVLLSAHLSQRQVIVDVLFAAGALVLMHLLLVSATDEQYRLMAELENAARVDGLTGTLTRAAFDDRLVGALQDPSSTSLMVLDIDLFKTINDTFGHPAGDAALRHVSAIATAAVRHDDGVVGRLGGDELAILLNGCPRDVAWRRAEELAASIGRQPLVLPDGTHVPISVSIGFAHAPVTRLGQPALSTPLYGNADAALYRAKHKGRGRAEHAV